MSQQKALQAIKENGILLVFPIQNRALPTSLWKCLHPRTKMRWEWDDSGDNRVADLWHLREELSRSGKVVYAKWYKNRATFFSPECFRWAVSLFRSVFGQGSLTLEEKKLLGIIADNSPSSTKEIRKAARQQFGFTGPQVEKTLVGLWRGLYIAGYGEVDDGAFPSLAIGTTEQLFERWCQQANDLDAGEARTLLEKKLGQENLFLKELNRFLTSKPSSVPRSEVSQQRITYEELVGRR